MLKLTKYTNLFRHFDKLDTFTNMVCKNTYEITRQTYPTSESLITFDESRYRQLYQKWGENGLFNHQKNEINPLLYGLINYNIESIDSALRSGYSVQSSLVIHPIEKYGSDALKNKYLEKLYNGKNIGCFGLTEPDSGSDPGSMKTRAIAHKDYYIVNGSKIWITNSPIADIFVLWCKDESNKIIGLVTERNDSLQTPFIQDKLTLLASPTGSIYIDNLKIPKTNQLNVVGLRGPFSCLNKARYGISWGVVGAMENIINTAIDYTEERRQFDKSLNSFQLVQNDLVRSIELYSNSLNNSFSSLNSIESFMDLEKNIALISFLKKNNCENALQVSRICRDILGGNGVSNSYNIMRHLMNLEAVNTYEGTRNIHTLILGRELLGKSGF
jgi:glutaryl-CoA dehydrogenase